MPVTKGGRKPLFKTKATKKAGRYASLVAHSLQHPNDAQSAKHLTHTKWTGYR